MTKKLEAEREHHRKLDIIAGKCSERTQRGEDHQRCAYCAYLVKFYGDQRACLNGRNPRRSA